MLRLICFSYDAFCTLSVSDSEPSAVLLQVLRLTQGACQILCTLTGHAGRVCSLAFHPAGAILLSGSEDQSIRAWDLPYEMQQAERERTRLLLKQQQQDGAVVRPQELQQQQQEESTATPHELQQAVREPSSPLSKNQQEEPSARHQQLEGKARQQQQSEQHLGAGLTQQHPAGSDGKSQRQQAPEATGSHQGEPSASLLEEPGGPAMGAGSRPEHTETSSSALPGRDAATAADRPWNAAAALACRLTDSATSEPEAAAQPLGGQAAAVEGRSTPFLGETNAARATAQMPGSHLEIASPAGAIAADTQQPHCTTAGTQAASPSLTLEEGPATSRVPRQPAFPSRAAEPQERADLPPLPAHGPQTLLAPIGLPFDTDANSGPQAPVQGRDSAAEGSHAAARAARPPVAGGKAQKKAAARYLPSLGAQQIVTADGVRAQVSKTSSLLGRLVCVLCLLGDASCACICTNVCCSLCGSTHVLAASTCLPWSTLSAPCLSPSTPACPATEVLETWFTLPASPVLSPRAAAPGNCCKISLLL